MPDQLTKTEHLKPAQPRIPGVPESTAKTQVEDEASAPSLPAGTAPAPIPMKWVVGACAAVLLFVLSIVWWSHSRPPSGSPASGESAASSTLLLPSARPAEPGLPSGPGPIATTEELAKPWASQKFNFKDKLTGELTPAMVIHLPGGAYWAFSLNAPFSRCELKYITDLSKLSKEYAYAADHPMLVDPCSRTVYDLARYGTGPNGLVRGEIVRGSGIRPPVAIEVRVEGHEVVAVRTE